MKITELLTLLAAALLLAGCGRQAPKGDIYAGGTPKNDGRPSVAAFISVNMKRVSLEDFVDSASSIYPHQVVVWINNAQPGAAYQVSAELFDSSGKSVEKSSRGIKAPDSVWYTAFEYVPPESPPKPGEWTWKVSVSGIGLAEKKFEMLAPSGAQHAEQARHQKARDGVLFAFANSWMHAEDFGLPCFFTALTTGKETADGKLGTAGILEVSGLKVSYQNEAPSRADTFNGITYRGRWVFSFDVFRLWKEGVWSEWQDVERYSNAVGQAFAQLRSDLRRVFPQGLPDTADNFSRALQMGGFNLVFDIMERDNHWYIDSNAGVSWIDQVQTKVTQTPKNAAPRYGFIEDQKKDADSPRRLIKKDTEDALKKTKGGVPQDRPDMLKTMKAVRETAL